MQINNLVLDAVTTVLDWDMPDEGYGDAVTCQLAGLDREEGWETWNGYGIDTPVH